MMIVRTYLAASDVLPNIPFATPENMDRLYQYIQVVFLLAIPFAIIYLAIEYAGTLISVIRDAFSRVNSNKDDDYDDGVDD